MRALAAVGAPPHHPLGVLHRDAALGALDEDDEGDHRHHDRDQDDQAQLVHARARGLVGRVELEDRVGHAGHDAGEDDEGDAVADAALGDLLAHPHDEGGAGRERDDGDDAEATSRAW